ncbi:MAG TPA: VWA domain-containing protein [Polyangiaceae bacterium]
MIFAGLPFATLAGIFGAAAAVMIGLYILKLRRRVVAVPFSPLWQKILRDKEATSLFSKLKRLLSLLLQLALLALLVLALGDPRAAATLIKGRNIVVLVDASASMQATDVSPNRLEVAKDEVKRLIRGMGGSDRMLVAQMDAAITPMGPMSGDTSELERAVDSVKATDARADWPRALRFATDTLRNVDNGEIVVVSDGNLGDAVDAAGPVHLGDIKLSYMPVGKAKDNVAITQFSVRRYPLDKSRYEVMLEVKNTSPDPADVELSLLGDGTLVDLTRLRLKPGEPLQRFYPNLSGASRTLEAKLAVTGDTKDDLPADNHAYALLPERRRAKVLVVSTGNTYLEAALLLDEYLDVTSATPLEYASKYAQKTGTFDAIIFDAATPAELPRTNALYLDPRGPGSPFKVEGNIEEPGFDKIDRKHPIVRFTALDQVNIARGHKLKPEPGDKVIGSSDGGGPIMVAGTRGGFKMVGIGFDVRDSDLPLRVAWPVLLLNTINYFTDEDASYLSSFRTGDVWRIPVGQTSTQATLTLPGGGTQPVPVHEGRAVFLGQRAGFYDLALAGDAHAPGATDVGQPAATIHFAANLLDDTESTIAPQEKLTVDGKEAGSVSAFHVGVRREIWIYLLMIAIAITALEWITYHRRLTV